jgi:hypothetical protein
MNIGVASVRLKLLFRFENADNAAEANGPRRQRKHCLTIRGCFQEHLGQQWQCFEVYRLYISNSLLILLLSIQ